MLFDLFTFVDYSQFVSSCSAVCEIHFISEHCLSVSADGGFFFRQELKC